MDFGFTLKPEHSIERTVALTKQAEAVGTAFHERFFDAEKKQYDNGTQTSSVLPLAFGLVPEADEAAVFDRLVRGPVLSETDRVVGKDEDIPGGHQCSHAQGIS